MRELNLLLDVGNTRTKYAFFEGRILKETCYEEECLFRDIEKWKDTGARIHLLFSGSGVLPENTKSLLNELADTVSEASSLMNLPLEMEYATPETLGFDRIAICVGAMSLCPHRPLLVIDSGTAITFNYVSEVGVFLGGNISPGMEMRFRSLHQYTARLPYVSASGGYGGIGRTTVTAIRNGVMEGMLFEVESYINRFRAEHAEGQVVITGGNSCFLKKFLTPEVLFSSELGFIGLNEILIYTKKFN